MKRYRLTESRLRGMIREAVKQCLTESKLFFHNTEYNNKSVEELVDYLGTRGFKGFDSYYPAPDTHVRTLRNESGVVVDVITKDSGEVKTVNVMI